MSTADEAGYPCEIVPVLAGLSKRRNSWCFSHGRRHSSGHLSSIVAFNISNSTYLNSACHFVKGTP